MAGGKNIRFSETKNKGMCDIGLPSGKSIFQIIADRIIRLNTLEVSKKIPVYIMTSDENYLDIKNYWKNNKFLGLD